MDEMCLELQHSEMEALAAVYTADSGDSFTFSTAADGTISGSIDIEVAADVCMQFTEMAHNDSTQLATGIDWQKVECLPPIRLDFTLPAAYPSDMPPQTSLSCCWLSETALAAVQQELSDIWTAEQGMCVLGLFIDYIQHDLKPSSTIRICLGSDQLAAERHVALILEYGNPKQKLCFESQAHMCPICMEEQSGLH
ncbi:E3 ubiquitin-protein ligase rnf14, partial [Coemansia erecta]